MRGAHASPTAGHREKDFREVLDEKLLLLGIEHEVAVALLDVRECGKDAAGDAEVGGTEVRTLLGTGKTEGDAGEVFRSGHGMEMITNGIRQRKSDSARSGFLVALGMTGLEVGGKTHRLRSFVAKGAPQDDNVLLFSFGTAFCDVTVTPFW